MPTCPNLSGDSSEGKHPKPPEIVEQLERILAHRLFHRALRHSNFLRFTVESVLAGRGEELTEKIIGPKIFPRKDYDPIIHNIVRVEAIRLRGKLAEYYQGSGQADPVMIELPRGGYVPRFIWRELTTVPQASSITHSNSVGREKEQNSLRAAFASVSNGIGQMLTVSGEAGIGKTTVIENFLAEIEGQTAAVWVARGRCSERLAETDAFAPILEALDDLRHGQSRNDVIEVLKRSAPAWHLQISPDMNVSGRAPAKESKLTSHERMRREFVYFLQELAAIRPVILFLDDLHWADASTCDLLAYLGTRMRNMRILVLTTYRPTSILLSKHPFFPLRFDLERRGLCRELVLSFLSPSDIKTYISAEFPQNLFPKEFIKVVYDRTEGNPLFMADMLRFLRDRGIAAKQDGSWRLMRSMSEVRQIIPDSIQIMIQLKIQRLHQEERRILRCAAVQGEQFDSAVIAQMLSRDPVEIEDRLQQLEAVHNFVHTLAETEFPNGIFSVRYQFIHVFYQNALYASLTAAARASLSLDAARVLANLSGDNSRPVAADLAVLFEAGRDHANAAHYFLQAARNAARVFAYVETIMLCERGLRALAFLPETRERDAQELMFSLTLGMALMIARGYGAPEVEKTYRRSKELCLKLNETRRLSPVLWGLHTCAVNTGNLAHALEVAKEMNTAAKASTEPSALI